MDRILKQLLTIINDRNKNMLIINEKKIGNLTRDIYTYTYIKYVGKKYHWTGLMIAD